MGVSICDNDHPNCETLQIDTCYYKVTGRISPLLRLFICPITLGHMRINYKTDRVVGGIYSFVSLCPTPTYGGNIIDLGLDRMVGHLECNFDSFDELLSS